MNDLPFFSELENRIRRVCNPEARYPVLWVVGAPRSGKTTLLQTLCTANEWKYINFTLDIPYLTSLVGQEETYRPEDFLASLTQICQLSSSKIIVIDEIEPVLSLWSSSHQHFFFQLIARTTRLSAGVVIVTRRISAEVLRNIVPGSNHVFSISLEQD